MVHRIGIQSLLKEIFAKNATAEGTALQFVNNLDWFGEMRLLNFLRDVGKHARLGTMMSKESVKSRLATESGGGSGLSFTEFSYQLLQGYDFYHLCRQSGTELQIGGSDQWGNITAGLDLIKRLWPSNEAIPMAQGLTFPLLVSPALRESANGSDRFWIRWIAKGRSLANLRAVLYGCLQRDCHHTSSISTSSRRKTSMSSVS